MYFRKSTACLVALSVIASGCSTRPRNFSAQINTPVQDRTAFESDYRTCEGLVRSGQKSGFRAAGTTAAISAGAVGGGVGAFAATTGGTASGWSGIGAGLGTAAAAATMVVGVVGFGLTRVIRSGREHRFKDRMTACLGEYGYEVASWEKLKKRDDPAAFASANVTVAQMTNVPTEAPVALAEASPQP
jgi:hypothetical protein